MNHFTSSCSRTQSITLLRNLPKEIVSKVLHEIIKSNALTDDRLTLFYTFTHTELRLRMCCSIRKSILRQIPFYCPQLRILDFSYSSQVNNPIVRGVLQHCTRLQVLELDACRHVTDQAFQPDYSPFCPLRACTSLKRLSIAKCSQITGKGLFLIAKTCSALIDLNVSYCRRIGNTAVDAFLHSSLPLLRLEISFMELDDRAFDVPQPFSPFTTLCGLEYLNLTHNKFTDASVSVLTCHCFCLQELVLDNCDSITDIALETLVRGKWIGKLKVLSLENCSQITDHGVLALCALTHLKTLNIAWCDITDKSVMKFVHSFEQAEEEEKFTHLRKLNVNWCTQLTDSTLNAITRIYAKRLDRLVFSQCPYFQICITGCKRMSMRQRQHAEAIGVDIVCLDI